MNPVAIAFWIMCTGIGYLSGGTTGAVVGLTSSVAVSFVLSILR